jgi:hypothetical protein
MSLASRILDRVSLQPSRDPIDPEQRRRRTIKTPFADLDVWIYDHRVSNDGPRVCAIKFPGAGGRAERGGPHPIDAWSANNGEIWIVNPFGYGASTGRASLQNLTVAADSVARDFQSVHPNVRPLVIGNSLGCSAALYLASRFDVAGLFLRNPVPIKELILGRHSWWNAGIVSGWLTRALPPDLDPVANAARCRVPAFFFQSSADRLVPIALQNLIINAYAGPKKVYVAEGLDHHELLPDSRKADYLAALEWLNPFRSR